MQPKQEPTMTIRTTTSTTREVVLSPQQIREALSQYIRIHFPTFNDVPTSGGCIANTLDLLWEDPCECQYNLDEEGEYRAVATFTITNEVNE